MKVQFSKKRITGVLRTYDLQKICRMYLDIHGELPMEVCAPAGRAIHHLQAYTLYNWAVAYSTSARMTRKLFSLLANPSRYYRLSAEEILSKYSEHGFYAPTKLMDIVNYAKAQVNQPKTRYTKTVFYGRTHLYFASPIYGHKDYNKWAAIAIEGNERFCELIYSYVTKHIPHENIHN